MINKTINGYTIRRKIGAGGMAEVWYAENKLGKTAAIKVLNPDLALNPNIVERFKNEALVMVRLSHPNIRQVYDYEVVDSRPCIIMEYLEGKDLKTLSKDSERIASETAVRYWDEIVSALIYTHEHKVVHRDIKPSNIFVTEEGHIKLLDFGIAKVRDSVSGTMTGQKLGTLIYMSPEQITDAKRVDYRTDIYSLAVSFVHLLSGRIPYDTDSSSEYVIMDQIVRVPVNMDGVPAEWQRFLSPYLSKHPDDRPALRPFTVIPEAPQYDKTSVEPEQKDGGVEARGPVVEEVVITPEPVVVADMKTEVDVPRRPEPVRGKKPGDTPRKSVSATSPKPSDTPKRKPNTPAVTTPPKRRIPLWAAIVGGALIALAALIVGLSTTAESRQWKAVQKSSDIEKVKAYMHKYPKGKYHAEACEYLVALYNQQLDTLQSEYDALKQETDKAVKDVTNISNEKTATAAVAVLNGLWDRVGLLEDNLSSIELQGEGAVAARAYDISKGGDARVTLDDLRDGMKASVQSKIERVQHNIDVAEQAGVPNDEEQAVLACLKKFKGLSDNN